MPDGSVGNGERTSQEVRSPSFPNGAALPDV
jgi:hypothetical protein